MSRKRKKRTNHTGSLQVITLCLSTALVLILLGSAVFTLLTARNLSSYVKENLVVTVLLSDESTIPESQRICKRLGQKRYVYSATYISPTQALQEHIKAMGSDPTDFLGSNPFVGSIEMQLKAEYANNDSLKWITKELRSIQKVTEITYQKDLIDQVNNNLKRISMVLIVLAALLTFISFSLINNTVRLSIFARRFTIHTMKLVGATKSFIRAPFLVQAVFQGIFSSLIAILALVGILFLMRTEFAQLFQIFRLDMLLLVMAIVVASGILICFVSTWFVVGKLVSLKKDDLYY